MNETRFEVYEDDGLNWWRLVAGSGRVIARSGEGYAHSDDAEYAAAHLSAWAQVALRAGS